MHNRATLGSGQGNDLNGLCISQHGCGDGSTEVDIEADVAPGIIEVAEAQQVRAAAANNVPALADSSLDLAIARGLDGHDLTRRRFTSNFHFNNAGNLDHLGLAWRRRHGSSASCEKQAEDDDGRCRHERFTNHSFSS